VTWFTFLPPFLFILAVARWWSRPTTNSSSRRHLPLLQQRWWSDPQFGGVLRYHVLWPKGFSGNLDWPSVLIAIAAAIALFRFQTGVIQVLMACALVGWPCICCAAARSLISNLGGHCCSPDHPAY